MSATNSYFTYWINIKIIGSKFVLNWSFSIPISGSDTITILVANKCDLEDKREVDEADIRVSVPIRCQLNSA